MWEWRRIPGCGRLVTLAAGSLVAVKGKIVDQAFCICGKPRPVIVTVRLR